MVSEKIRYKDLNQALNGLRDQVIDSLDYCHSQMPKFDNPKKMFKYLRLITTYKHDPPGIELLQSVPTLIDNNFWGISGAGDCDCFTILTLAMCVANGMNDNQIILVSNKKSRATHIYSGTIINKEKYTLDLTNPYINIERPYKYRQILTV